jgi:hypothetical protein
MVDEYMKYDFEDVISGGVKTKFKVIFLFNLVYERQA